MVSRETGAAALEVVDRTDRKTLTGFVTDHTADGTTAYAGGWKGYGGLAGANRGHATVCRAPGSREWARDDDGDGVREVHDNTLEGLWAALRTFLRPFRGVSKHKLGQYVAVSQRVYNLKAATPAAVRKLLGLTPDAS